MNKEEKKFKPKRGQIPTKYCSNCANCTKGFCGVHARPVDKNYNRCFYHSYYQPNSTVFKVANNLDEIMKQEQAIEKKRQQGWITEHNKMVDEMQKEIQLAKKLKRAS